MERTVILEAQTKGPAPMETWQEKISTCLENQQMNIDKKCNAQDIKLDALEFTMKKQGETLDTLVAGINAVMSKTATTEEIGRLAEPKLWRLCKSTRYMPDLRNFNGNLRRHSPQ
eukprot:3205542-Ditylum_brightwellii.AAC.1